MQSRSVEQEAEKESKESKRLDAAAVGAMVVGAVLMGTATVGILSNEALTKDEAMMSADFGDHVYFMEAEELPYFAVGAIGLISFSFGLLSRRNEEE
jgi:glycerol uptake facilitator-like aquaporin